MWIVLVWFLNFGISWFNAWVCGKSWNESKHVGGVAHFMNWMGAIMSASGFTWCYTILAVLLGRIIPVEQADGTYAPAISEAVAQATLQLGYLVVIFPILGSGLAITIQAWAAFWRRRTFGNGAVAAYDTFAMAHNIYGAVRHVPEAGRGVSSFFKSDGDDKGKGLVLVIVVGALLGGILTTRAILLASARAAAQNRSLKYDRG